MPFATVPQTDGLMSCQQKIMICTTTRENILARYVDSTLIPITFRYMNRKNEGDFFDGLLANSYIEEDITKDFGDPEETLLQEVLYFIENGCFTGSGVKKSFPADLLLWDHVPPSGAI